MTRQPAATKYGYVVNLEQAVADDIGLFARWSWNNGKTEIMSFTDIDASLSLRHLDQGQRHGAGPTTRSASAARSTRLSRDHRDSSRPAGSAF